MVLQPHHALLAVLDIAEPSQTERTSLLYFCIIAEIIAARVLDHFAPTFEDNPTPSHSRRSFSRGCWRRFPNSPSDQALRTSLSFFRGLPSLSMQLLLHFYLTVELLLLPRDALRQTL